MTDFERLRFGFRFAETQFGDTLQTVAARELGDAARWPDLVSYNKLVPPFITDDPTKARDGVLLTGQPLLVPAPSPVATAQADPDEVFGSDVQLNSRGELLTDGTDFVVISGSDNLVQALGCRVRTERRELIFHPDYGCDARRVIGRVNGPTKTILVSRLVKASVNQDPRVSRVRDAVGSAAGDAISVSITAETVAGRSVQATATP